MDQLHVREDQLDLAALQLADEVPAQAPGARVALASSSWARFSPTASRPASASAPSSSSATYLTAASSSTSPGRARLVRPPRRSRVEDVGAGSLEPGQSRHATPAWRPVTPRVAAVGEEQRRVGAHRAQAGVVDGLDPGCAQLGARRPTSRARLRSPTRASMAREARRGPPRRPRSSSRAAPGPSAAVTGPAPPTSRSARTPSATIAAGQAAPAAVQHRDGAVGDERDRQAVGGEHERRGVGQRGRLPVLVGAAAPGPGGSVARRTSAPCTWRP